MERCLLFCVSCLLAGLPLAAVAQSDPGGYASGGNTNMPALTPIVLELQVATDSGATQSSQTLPDVSESTTQDADELAKQLSNPVSSLISVPFQFNYDTPVGNDGDQLSLTAQPVIPISISDNWNMISRTLLPLIYQRDVIPGENRSGLGDVTQTLFFSPKEPGPSGLIWGAGPVFVLPTGERGLGNKTWGAGASFVVLKQIDSWTVGALANHVVDVGGGRDRVDISSTFLQPFLSKGFSGGRTVSLNSESTYDWNTHRWTVPINLMFVKVTKIGSQRYSFSTGIRGYAQTPGKGPDWGLRFAVVLLYPK